MGLWHALSAGVFLFFVCSRAGAQSREPGPWIEGRFGVGFALGQYESEGIKTEVSGGGLDIAGAFGHTLSESWALGIVPNLVLGPFRGAIDDSSVGVGYMASLSVEAAYRASRYLILRPALGVERAAFSGSNDDAGSVGGRRTTREWDPVRGPVVNVTVSLGEPSGFWVRLATHDCEPTKRPRFGPPVRTASG